MRKILLLLLITLLLQQATPAQNTWTGSTSANWNVASNWGTNQVPTASDDVIIPSTTNQPVISTVGAAAKTVEVQNGATLTIENTGSLAVNGGKFFNGGHCAFGNLGTVNNSGHLLIGNLSNSGGYGLWNINTFNNNTGGQITIDRSNAYCLVNYGAFTNAAAITIGAVAGVGGGGLSNEGTFNNAGGQIQIDRIINVGAGLNNSGPFGTFTNAATITIGAVAGVGGYGLQNAATFNNITGGQISINNSTSGGLNNAGGTFTNAATITIGDAAGVGQYGLQNVATFNNTGGQISIDNSSFSGLFNGGGTFTNAATIIIGGAASVGTYGLLNNNATFNNTGCAVLTLFAPLYNDGITTNEGLFTLNTTGTHTNDGFANNAGILVYPQGNPIPNVTNQAVVAAPLSVCTTITPALGIAAGNPFTIGSTWYKDQALTQPAGTFTVGNNTFMASGLTTGSTAVYFTVSNGNTCTQIVSIPVTLLDGCTGCPNATGLNTTNIAAQSARLEWIASSDPARWQVQYRRADSATWTNIKLAGSARSISVSSLVANQKYKWHIRAKCGKTWTGYSKIITFKTLSSAPLTTSTQEAVSIKNTIEENSAVVKLFPNPTRGQFIIELHLADEINTNAKIQFVNMVGQTVSAENANISNGVLQKTVSIYSSLTPGIYIVKVVVAGKTYASKLVYEK